jgi:hypothetical protein
MPQARCANAPTAKWAADIENEANPLKNGFMKRLLRRHEAFPFGKHEARLRRMKGTNVGIYLRFLDVTAESAYNKSYQNILR